MTQRVISHAPRQGDKIASHRKEGALDCQWSLIDLNTGKEIVTLRTYYPSSVCYACVWTHSDALGYSRGSDKAGGGGYCKRSAAAYGALLDAGFVFEEPFSGRGEPSIEDALGAIAKMLGLRKRFAVIKAHG